MKVNSGLVDHWCLLPLAMFDTYFTFAREEFKVSDVNADNVINHDELNQMMANIGEKMSPRETEMMIKEVDKNGDGVINFEEFFVFNSEK